MATDSLVIGDIIELIGAPGGIQSTLPELQNAAGQGAIFQLLGPPGGGAGTAVQWTGSYDFSTPQPTTDIVQSLLLDGERPFGYRSSNRTIVLPVKITAPDFVTMTAARELLMSTIDQQTWTLTWTPAATGLPLVFDCFRAQPTTVSYGFLNNMQPLTVLNLTFQALPYGRSDPNGLQQVAFASPLIGGVAAPPSPQVLDSFSSVSGTNWSRSTTQYVVGPGVAHWTPPAAPWGSVCTYTKTGLPSLSISGLPVLSVWYGSSYDTAHFGPWPAMVSNITLNWTLTDNASHTLSFHKTYNKCPWSNNANAPKWTRLTANIPQTSTVFNYSAVTAYKVTISNWVYQGTPVLIREHAWLDDVVANPPSLAIPASQRGVIYNIMGAVGTARTPFSAQFQLPQSGPVQTELSGSGVWWPPVGVTSVKAEAVGAGGSGGSRSTSGVGGGGGGGEYAAEPSLTVAAGTPVPYSCGTGGQPAPNPTVVTFSTAGSGNWLCPAGVTTVQVECWGSGAGGAPGGGGGGGGEYAKETSVGVTPGTRYPFTVGGGGSGAGYLPGYGTVSQRNGNTTTFAGDSLTVTAHGGLTGLLGGTTAGAGGSGSSNSTHYSGGSGGTAPSTGGGGGGGSGGSASAGNAGGNASGATAGTGATAVTGGGAGGAGAALNGWPVAGSVPGGGGGGGFSGSYNGGGGNGGAGQVKLTYTVGGGAAINGANTTFGSATTTGTIVTAHGGSSVAANTATGASGGSGSSNTTHYSGGAGWTASGTGGGGGGSGGSSSAGNAATSATGASAVAGGGKGANGASTADTGGSSASPPGGGGGGAYYNTTAQTGGQGGNGDIVLTWTPPLANWGTLIAHRPSQGAPPSLNPCVPVTNTYDTPTGIQYTIPSLISGVNALFGGTYSVVLVNYYWDSPTVSRQITVSVYQYEYVGGPSYATSLTRSVIPSTDITNGIVVMGELTLPIKDIDPSNTSAYFAVSINDTDSSDQYLDVLFLDTQGQTVMVNIAPGNTYTNFFIDEPTADRDLGRIMGSDLDRSQAISVLDAAIVSGGPFYLLPGDNTFLAYSPSGAPNLGVSYLPRWFTDRTS